MNGRSRCASWSLFSGFATELDVHLVAIIAIMVGIEILAITRFCGIYGLKATSRTDVGEQDAAPQIRPRWWVVGLTGGGSVIEVVKAR